MSEPLIVFLSLFILMILTYVVHNYASTRGILRKFLFAPILKEIIQINEESDESILSFIFALILMFVSLAPAMILIFTLWWDISFPIFSLVVIMCGVGQSLLLAMIHYEKSYFFNCLIYRYFIQRLINTLVLILLVVSYAKLHNAETLGSFLLPFSWNWKGLSTLVLFFFYLLYFTHEDRHYSEFRDLGNAESVGACLPRFCTKMNFYSNYLTVLFMFLYFSFNIGNYLKSFILVSILLYLLTCFIVSYIGTQLMTQRYDKKVLNSFFVLLPLSILNILYILSS